MKAMVLERHGDPHAFRWQEWPTPEPGPGEIRIRIEAVSVNPVDCKMRAGHLPVPLPAVLGRDVAGVVDAVGDGVDGFAEGDSVMAVLFGPRSNGAYAEYVGVPSGFVAHAPAHLDRAGAAACGVAGLTAFRAVAAATPLGSDGAVLVAGASGGVGSFAVPLLHEHGVGRLVATAGSDASERYLVESLRVAPGNVLRHDGADLAALAERARAIAGPGGVARAFDFVGGDMKRLCFEAIGFEGRVISVVEEDEAFAIPIWQPGGPMFEKSASYHFVATSARARNGSADDWAVYRRWLDEWMALAGSGALTLPRVEVLGSLTEDNIAAAHARLEAGGQQGKLALVLP